MRKGANLVLLLILVLVAACSRPRDAIPDVQENVTATSDELGQLVATVVTGRTGPGAEYEIWVPPDWKGRLILYAHGYLDPALPPGFPESLPPELELLRTTLLDLGYAVAYSSYSEHGYALKDGVQRTHQLRGLFTRHFSKPERVYLMGHSLGGMVVLMMAERYGQYDGALSFCSFLGGGLMQVEYIADARVLFDAFYPELSNALIPGDAVNVPPGLDFAAISGGIVESITAEFASNPAAPLLRLLSLATIEQIQLPFDPALLSGIPVDDPAALALWLADPANAPQVQALVGQIVGSLLGALYYNVVGGHDLYGRTHRRSPFDNTGTLYSGPFLDTGATAPLNAAVARFSATPDAVNYLLRWYQPTGKLRMPLLAMHTTLDPDVPFRHQAAYAEIAGAAGSSHLLVQRAIDRYGHCTFTPEETLGALANLVAWAELGIAP